MTGLSRAWPTLILLFIASLTYASDSQQPKIEIGAALGAQYLADYRGSKEYGANGLPFPIFHYRGDRIKIDRQGIRGDLLKEKNWELNVSGEVSLNGADEDNRKRTGMPALDSAFEFGPSLNIALDGNIDDDGWLVRLPVRSVIAAGLDRAEYIGYVFNPKLTYLHEKGPYDWRSSTSIGVLWGSEKFHDYFYEVAPQFVLEDRPMYNATKGFSGIYFKTSLVKRTGDWRYGVSLRYDNLSDATFRDSPLVETDHFFSISFLFARYFWKSKD